MYDYVVTLGVQLGKDKTKRGGSAAYKKESNKAWKVYLYRHPIAAGVGENNHGPAFQ